MWHPRPRKSGAFAIPHPFLRIVTFEIRDVYEDGTMGPSYTRVECATEVLPDPKELYEVNYAAGWLTKNQFSWVYEEKLGCTLKALALNSESQVPEAAQALAEIPKGLAELAREIKRAPLAAIPGGSKKVAETVKLLTLEYRRIEAGRVFP